MNSSEPYRLLLLEPSASTAAPIRALLEHNGFVVDVADNLGDVRTRDLVAYAVLIVNIHGDDRDAMDFVHELHLTKSHLVGRIVVISADDGPQLERKLQELGVCDVVPKPVNAQEILRAVHECLEKNPAMAVN